MKKFSNPELERRVLIMKQNEARKLFKNNLTATVVLKDHKIITSRLIKADNDSIKVFDREKRRYLTIPIEQIQDICAAYWYN